MKEGDLLQSKSGHPAEYERGKRNDFNLFPILYSIGRLSTSIEFEGGKRIRLTSAASPEARVQIHQTALNVVGGDVLIVRRRRSEALGNDLRAIFGLRSEEVLDASRVVKGLDDALFYS